MRKIACGIVILWTVVLQAQNISINEFMSNNEATITDEDGDSSDWIELYNSGEIPIDLSGWYLSDDNDIPMKWQIESAVIEANNYLLVFASSKNRSGPGELHANFKISSAGEVIILTDLDGILVHLAPSVSLSADISFGSAVNGIPANQVFFSPSSPNSSNSEGTEIPYASDVIGFSIEGGFYDSGFGLLLNSAMGGEIRFTLDGSVPDMNSQIYTSQIEVLDRVGQADFISLINTGINWEEPRTIGEKATVVKAASFLNEIRVSPVYTETYFIGPSR